MYIKPIAMIIITITAAATKRYAEDDVLVEVTLVVEADVEAVVEADVEAVVEADVEADE
jgi:hypothetical protein